MNSGESGGISLNAWGKKVLEGLGLVILGAILNNYFATRNTDRAADRQERNEGRKETRSRSEADLKSNIEKLNTIADALSGMHHVVIRDSTEFDKRAVDFLEKYDKHQFRIDSYSKEDNDLKLGLQMISTQLDRYLEIVKHESPNGRMVQKMQYLISASLVYVDALARDVAERQQERLKDLYTRSSISSEK